MSNDFKILELNKHLSLVDGVYHNKDVGFRDPTDRRLPRSLNAEIDYVLTNTDDKSLFSLELEQALKTEALVSALSARPYYYLKTFNLERIQHALDLSQDIGGVAHYLSQYASSVESIKVNPDIAKLAQRRCTSKSNVVTISEDLQKLSLPTTHYDLIVIGNLADLPLDDNQFAQLMNGLQASLSPQGVLVLSALNKHRLSKWFNAKDLSNGTQINFRDLYTDEPWYTEQIQQLGLQDQTLEGAPLRNAKLAQVELPELRRALRNANFAEVHVHVNFSSDNNYNNLFSADYLSTSLNPINHFYRLGCIDNPEINEFLLFNNLHKSKTRVADHADKYLLLCGANNKVIRTIYDNDFSHFPGTSRKPKWRTITTRAKAAAHVVKQPLYSQLSNSAKRITQNLAPQPFHAGKLLVEDWLSAILANDSARFKQLVQEYSDWLHTLNESNDFQTIAYDLLPFNLVVKEKSGSRTLLPIDTEWQLNKKFSPDFVLFRALFWFAFQNHTLLKHYAERLHCTTLGLFVVTHMDSMSVVEDLNKFVRLEEKVQAKIDHQFRKRAVHHSLTQPLYRVESEDKNALQVNAGWSADNSNTATLNSSDTQWTRSCEPRVIEIQLSDYDSNKPILNLSAESSSGAYELLSLSLLNDNQDVLWSARTAKKINAAARVKRALHNSQYFAVRAAEPAITFDLSKIDNIEKARTLTVEISWLAGFYNDGNIKANLSSQLIDQVDIAHANKLNEYRADVEYQASRIKDLIDRSEGLQKHIVDLRKTRQQLNGQITDLHERLHAQMVRNEELHSFLLMRPGTRAKRVATRALQKVTGSAVATDEPTTELVEEQLEPHIDPSKPKDYIGQNQEDYGEWVAQHALSEQDITHAKAEIDAMAIKPVFSILVPIYNTDPEYLIPMIRSVQNQIYPYWQLCLVDDCSPNDYICGILEYEAAKDERITIQLNDVNQGIALTTNDALTIATGDYIALLDHDDEISIDALYENAKAINQNADADLLYSDEDKMDMQGQREEPYFKPDYSPDLLHTNNYICHFTVMKKSIADDIGGFREGLDGSQDHDIILRAAAKAEHVIHIPKILYHWRKIPGSTAVVYDSKSYAWEAGRKAVENTLAEREDGIRVEFGALKGSYRVLREIKGEPLVSIIVPFKDKPELLDSCLNSIITRSTYPAIEIIGVSNNSEDPLTHERMTHFQTSDKRIRFVEKNIPFNFSAICNYGVEQAKGEYIVLLNNDIEIISPDWIERMLEHAQRPNIGAVGGKLLYPDGRIQHAGVVVGMVGAAGHPHKFFPNQHIGYHGRLHMVYNVSAITGAMMMMRKDKFEQVGGLDEQNLAVAYNDVDLCLKLMDHGYRNLFTPHATATHHESISRGYEDTDEKMQRLLAEQTYFLEKWHDFISAGDPYYNPNLSLENEKFSLKYKN